jgi:ketosteroid isomerase-like protein
MSSWSEKFIDAFNTHEVEPMQALTSPDILWEDVSGHIEFKGLDGVRDMVQVTIAAIPDCKFTHHGGMTVGNSYVVEWTMSGTIFGKEFACRGASVGETDDAGLIVHNRDYWDSRSFPEMPAGPQNPSMEEVEAKKAALSS